MKRRLLFLFAVFMVATSVGWGQSSGSWKSHASSSVIPSGDIYGISSAGDLAWVMNQVNAGTDFSGKTIQLNTDIDLDGYLWEAIGESSTHAFAGTFDGQNHTIANMIVNVDVSADQSSDGVGGLFGCVRGKAVIKNVSVVSGSVSVKAYIFAYAGTFAAHASDKGSTVLIENCHSSIPVSVEITSLQSGNTSDHRAYAGGIVGDIGNTTGGLSPDSGEDTWAIIRKCSSTGKVASKAQVEPYVYVLSGGMAGRIQQTKVLECYSTGAITVEGGDCPYAGGVVGHSSYNGFISNCYSTSDVTSSSNITDEAYSIVGGICGSVSKDSKIDYCYATGRLSASLPNTTGSGSEVFAGGIAGYTISSVQGIRAENCIAFSPSITINPSSYVPEGSRLLNRIYGKLAPENTTLNNVYAYGGMTMTCGETLSYPEKVAADSQGGMICSMDDIKRVFSDNSVWTLSADLLPILKNNSGTTMPLTTYDFSLVNNVADLLAAIKAGKEEISLAEGTYTLPTTLSLDKSITLQGAGQGKTIIIGATVVNGSANNTATNVNVKGLSFDYAPTKVSTGKCVPIIEVSGNADLLISDCVMNNNTQGYGDRKHSKPAEAWQNAILLGETAKGNVCIQNTTIYLKGNSQSGVLVDGELTDVSLVNSRIEGDAKGSNQFGLCIHHEKTPITLDNSTILLNNHYCIYANNAGNQKLTIKNKSNVVGYGALYLYETSNMNVHVSGESLLTGKTKNNGTSDSFATVVISTNNSTAEASNNTIVIEDSYIGNKYDMQETRGMTPIKINGSFTPIPSGNRFILKGKTILSTSDNVKSPILVSYGVDPDEYDNVVVVEGNDVQFQDQYGKSCVIITKPDGSFVNAVVSIISAIDFGELYGTTYYHEEVAHAGEMIMLPDTTIAETIRSLNAAEYNFFNKPPTATSWDPYTIPDGVVFNCKDGCLVTNESDAKAFAIGNPYKRVYWLQQGEEAFTMKECVVAIDIAKDTTWATSFADRQVNVLNGATLTISSAMALDTVTIEEGAQVISTATGDKVTAKSLRFAPVLSGDKWKDLGMPFTSGVIKNSKGETVATPSLKDANEGIWFANLKDSKTPQFTVDETAFGMAGLWAANGGSYTISSKETFEFKTLEEPVAPTETGTFLMCSNPNTFAITLKQSAYILTADGQSFEQEANPEIKPFQSFVLTDTKTLSTLRSLRIGEGVVTGNQTVEPVDGYYVSTERGAIVIHTAEAVDVMIIGMNGKVAYRGEATDGQRIELPSGIYAVNGQLVRVK